VGKVTTANDRETKEWKMRWDNLLIPLRRHQKFLIQKELR